MEWHPDVGQPGIQAGDTKVTTHEPKGCVLLVVPHLNLVFLLSKYDNKKTMHI